MKSTGPLPQHAATAAFLVLTGTAIAQEPQRAERPGIPYRLWYDAKVGDAPEITVSTSSRTDARALEAAGIHELGWAYGTQIGWNAGAKYWEDQCSVKRRTVKANGQHPRDFVIAGIALDEWVPPKLPASSQWILDGLTEGRKQNPEIFIACWANYWKDEEMYDLLRNNTIDLQITQGYTRAPDRGMTDGWEPSVRELETMSQRGLIHKSILSLGQITDAPHHQDGSIWTEAELREKMFFLRDQFPDSPGIGFFGWKAVNAKKKQELVDTCNRLAAEYWPDTWLADGVYSLTPQAATGTRVGVTAGEVTISRAAYPGNPGRQQWRITKNPDGTLRIRPASDRQLALTAAEGEVVLSAAADHQEQKWRFRRVRGGYHLSPADHPDQFLGLDSTAEGTALSVGGSNDTASCLFALVPEIHAGDPIPPVYQAEEATLDGTRVGTYGWSHTGEGYVHFDAKPEPQSLTFNNARGGDTDGGRQLVIRYSLETGTATLKLKVNHEVQEIELPATGSEAVWIKRTFQILLGAGETNTIILSRIDGSACAIDAVQILPLEMAAPGKR